MKINFNDKPLIISIILAHVLLFFTYTSNNYFWALFGISQLLFIAYSIRFEHIYYTKNFFKELPLGVLSSVLLFSLFFVGNFFIELLNLPFEQEINLLYSKFTPTAIWHYVVLFLIIIPGEEFFWRGFIQKRLTRYTSPVKAIIFGSILYALAQIYCGFFILPIIAIIAGCFWGYLYYKYQSLTVVIVSHTIFNLFLFILFPFH